MQASFDGKCANKSNGKRLPSVGVDVAGLKSSDRSKASGLDLRCSISLYNARLEREQGDYDTVQQFRRRNEMNKGRKQHYSGI